MTDQNPPAGFTPSSEPTVPVPTEGHPSNEATVIDPLWQDSGYPDFSYGSASATPSESAYIDPDPLPAAANYAQPYAPPPAYQAPASAAPSGYPPAQPQPEPAYAQLPPAQTEPQYPQYPQYPNYSDQGYPNQAMTPLQNPVSYNYGYASPVTYLPDHPNGVISLVLALVGFLFFPLLCPIAWFLAAQGRKEAAANPGRWSGGGTLTAGLVIGIIGTVIWGLFVALFFGLIILGAASSGF